MPSGDEHLEQLRCAIDQLAAADAEELVEEARVQARARVRSRLVELMEQSMLEHAQQQLAPGSRRTEPLDREPGATAAVSDQPPSKVDPETGSAWYVYGVVAGSVKLDGPLSGVDASHPVQLLGEGPLAAVVSEVALEEFGEETLREHLRDMAWVEMVARAHERVLDRTRARTTVIPMRMCTVYRTESGVRDMLRREARALREAIEHLDGKAEWGVKAFAQTDRLAAGSAEDDEPDGEAPGAAYMRRRRDERDLRERARQLVEEGAAQIHERLCSLAADGQVTPPQRPEVSGHVGDMVLNGVYLVPDDLQEQFHEEVLALQAEFGPLGIELELTGPWPAYNFVPGTIGAAW